MNAPDNDTQRLLAPLAFGRGKPMRNHFMLAPLTNMQSHPDGTLSDDEHRWLTMRATGGFGSVMTAAAHVQAIGQGFAGQLGVFGDMHVPGLTRLAAAINAAGAQSLVQLHHAGNRAPAGLIGTTPVYPSDDEKTGARGLSLGEVEALVDDFASAAQRAERAGFDGVEVHGAHGYIVCAFISAQSNRRVDRFGGDLAGRSTFLYDVIAEIRRRCRPDFILGVRLSAERFGIDLGEAKTLAAQLLVDDRVDFLDISMWDCFKLPEDEAHRDRTLAEHFGALERRGVALGAAGKITSPADALRVLAGGVDFPIIGRAAMLHHDYPQRLASDPSFVPVPLPVTMAHLREQGLSDTFVNYVGSTWKDFMSDFAAAAPGT